MLLLAASLVPTASAAPIIYFGEDLNGPGTGRIAHPNSTTAETDFKSALTASVGTEDFESVATGQITSPPGLPISFPGAGTATVQGQTLTIRNLPTVDWAGRYPTSGNQFLDAGADLAPFQIDFDSPGGVAAFGFYGVDIGDFSGSVTVTLLDLDDVSTQYVIPHTVAGEGSLSGSVLYWGIIDTLNPFKRVTFGNTAAGVDVFGFDDMTIGTPEQVETPEPGTLALVGLGLVVVARRGRKARSRQQS